MKAITLQTAVKMTGKSESTLRRDVKKGKLSATRDDRRHLQFDIAELQRVYGEMKTTGEDAQSTEQGNGKSMTGHDSAEIIAIKDNQITDLKSQLEHANAEKKELLELANRLQKQNEVLMLPNSEKAERKEKGWLLRLVGAR